MPRKDPAKQKEYRRQYYLANREKALAQMAEWRASNFERHADARHRSKLKAYGLTPEEYRTLLERQGGACAICGDDAPRRTFHLDHDHETGRVRGILCNSCNRGIGLLKDDVAVLRSAVAYLERAGA